ncbi:MAG: hypothetical protein HY861_03935 [Chlamydiia bacterium]|nr:hypothetical protein [Chlamydiia bacterium]
MESSSSIGILKRGLKDVLSCTASDDCPYSSNDYLEVIGGASCIAGEIRSELTVVGDGTPLGMLIAPCAQIRAFGPQTAPLHDGRGFGIRSLQDPAKLWVSAAAIPEVCLTPCLRSEAEKIWLEISFVGVKASPSLFFSFYVKAAEALVGGEEIRPRTLNRYVGAAKPMVFGGGLLIESHIPGKLELIPLAGERQCWGCEYLAAFVMPPLCSKAIFSFSYSNSA